MPSMTREEALTKLAMEVHPKYFASICFSRDEYLAERERLINKPSWEDAPEEANFMAQDPDGQWAWYAEEPMPCEITWLESIDVANWGAITAGHDWRTTLERRPNRQKPALSEECTNSAIDNRHPQEYKTSWGIDAAWDGEYPEPIFTNQFGETDKKSKYHREIKPGVFVDVYDVIKAWDVTNPALQHLIKKALQPGQRGHKSTDQDMQDIIESAVRAKELEK